MKPALLCFALLAAAALATGCSDDTATFGDAARRADGGSSGMDGGGGDPGDGGGSTPDAVPVRDGGGTTLGPDAACAMQTSDTTRAPMNLLLVLDRSGSMADNGKWTAAVAGINRLLTLLSDDTRVGLTLFPIHADTSDTESDYARPRVPIAPLSTSRAMIMSALAATSPNGGTPMACAMVGSVGFYNSMFTMDGSRNIVLITDGEPTEECSGETCGLFDVNCLLRATSMAKLRIQATVASGAMHMPEVRTFVVATPDADPLFLSNLATNGDTPRAPGCAPMSCHYSLGTASFETDLNHALDAIRGRAATCEYRIMVDTSVADPGLINVTYTPMPGGATRTIPRDVTHTNGWDYSTDMRSVILHGAICDEVRMNTTGGRVQILYGCPTQVPG